ncbi:hypothetical protein WDU94_000902 [Cyamophila willieti]
MVFVKTCLAVCASAILFTQGESHQLCGQEVEYRGFNPIEALQLIQARQVQEFEQFKNTLSQLKFKLQSEDYFAWKRCLSEYEKEKLRYLGSVEKCKSSFNGLVQSLATRKLAAAQYDLELQKIFQQFQTQFTPAANLFKTNIKYLLDTIRDDDRRKKWWSTVKTTEEVTTSDGKTTRTLTTQQGESRLLCGQEVEYRGFNPIEALQLIQARQFQEFEQFKNTISQLKFKLQSEDYFAWKRCLSEYEKEKLRYLESVEKCKSSFNELVQSLATRKLSAAQYDLELQKIFQQFQTQFTPSANLFKTNIKYLLDTIRDDDRRKKWWSTVKTTEEVTTSDGKTTRTLTTQVDSGIGNKRTQAITKKSQSVSSSGYDA